VAQITRAQKLRVGIFMASGLTVLIGGLVILAGMKLGERRDRYLVRYQEAAVSLSGLEVGAPVKYSGIRVGRVDGIHIDPSDVSVVIVDLSLDHGTPVAEDEKADLGSQGITGLKYIELTRGSARARVREVGEAIPPGQSAFDALTTQAGEIAAKVEKVLDRVADLTGSDMKTRVASILDRTDRLLETVDGMLEENRSALRTLTERLGATAEKTEEVAGELAGLAHRANALLGETTALIKGARAAPDKLNALLDEGNAVLGPEGLQRTVENLNTILARGRRDLLETLTLLHETAENVSALSERLRDDPTLLLRHESEEDSQ
jgi:phospholipid/cholesterol/gamma-HCH transport system substrate-binding protein